MCLTGARIVQILLTIVYFYYIYCVYTMCFVAIKLTPNGNNATIDTSSKMCMPALWYKRKVNNNLSTMSAYWVYCVSNKKKII